MLNDAASLLKGIGLESVTSVFAELVAAEEVIVTAQKKYPDKADELSELFLVLMPPTAL